MLKRIFCICCLLVVLSTYSLSVKAVENKESVLKVYDDLTGEGFQKIFIKDDKAYFYYYNPEAKGNYNKLLVTDMVSEEKEYQLENYHCYMTPIFNKDTNEYITITNVNDEYKILKSKDLISWELIEIDYKEIMKCNDEKIWGYPFEIVYDEINKTYVMFGHHVAVGSFQTTDTTIAVSKDLINWEYKGLYDINFDDVAYGNGKIVVVGEHAKVLIGSGKDDWIFKTTTDHYFNDSILTYLTNIVFDGEKFVIAGTEIYDVRKGEKYWYDFSWNDIIITEDFEKYQKVEVGEGLDFEYLSYNDKSGTYIVITRKSEVYVSDNAKDWKIVDRLVYGEDDDFHPYDIGAKFVISPYKDGFIIYNKYDYKLHTYNVDCIPKIQTGKQFKDVKWSDWYYKFLYKALEKGIVNGFSDNTIRPNSNLTRDQFITMLVNSLGYSDLEKNSAYWAQPFIDKAIDLKIISEDMFSDYKVEITRGEMASIIANVLDTLEENDSNNDLDLFRDKIKDYEDIPVNQRDSVLNVYSKGIITGLPDGTFDPNKFLTRAEGITVIIRILELL